MSEPSGLQIMQENIAALESGDDAPHTEETVYEEAVEEVITEPTEEVAETEEEASSEPEISELAKKDGFMTKEQWVESGKSEEDYMTPEEFSKVGELRDDGGITRQQLSKRLVQMESVMKETLKNSSQMIEDAKKSEREKVISELKAEQKEAVEYQDTEKALELERKINDEEAKDKPEVKEEPEELGPSEAMTTWYDSNNHWYGTDQGATNLINAELTKFSKAGLPFEEGIIKAEIKAKKYFPQYFDDVDEPLPEKKIPARPKSVSETSRRKSSSEAKKTFKDLDPNMQVFARKAAKASGLSEAQYMESM